MDATWDGGDPNYTTYNVPPAWMSRDGSERINGERINGLVHLLHLLINGVFLGGISHLPSLKLTARPSKWMVGIRSFPIGEAYFQVLLLLVSGRVLTINPNQPNGTSKWKTLLSGGCQGGLPPGWESAQDPSSGKTYYFNRSTNVAWWSRFFLVQDDKTNREKRLGIFMNLGGVFFNFWNFHPVFFGFHDPIWRRFFKWVGKTTNSDKWCDIDIIGTVTKSWDRVWWNLIFWGWYNPTLSIPKLYRDYFIRNYKDPAMNQSEFNGMSFTGFVSRCSIWTSTWCWRLDFLLTCLVWDLFKQDSPQVVFSWIYSKRRFSQQYFLSKYLFWVSGIYLKFQGVELINVCFWMGWKHRINSLLSLVLSTTSERAWYVQVDIGIIGMKGCSSHDLCMVCLAVIQ